MNYERPTRIPTTDTVADRERLSPLNTGLTKLEYFAGLAMQGLLSNQRETFNSTGQEIAEKSVNIAKELIKQLENDI